MSPVRGQERTNLEAKSTTGLLGPAHKGPSSPGQERKTPTPSLSAVPVQYRVKPKQQPGLERNESMVYEEEVPVIVRRRGCMLRVRITSFADDGDVFEESGRPSTPISHHVRMIICGKGDVM